MKRLLDGKGGKQTDRQTEENAAHRLKNVFNDLFLLREDILKRYS